MDILTKCQICGGSNFEVLSLGPDTDIFAKTLDPNSEIGWNLCRDCGLIFQNPRISRATIEEFYQSSCYRVRDGEVVIDDGYKAYSPNQLLRYRLWMYNCGVALDRIRGATCLDYGCGIGGALDFMGRNGNTVHGVEPDNALAAYGNRHYAVRIVGRLEDLPPEARYDLIFSHHSLEHAYDPSELVAFAGERLSDTGLLVIVVPTWRHGNTKFAHLTMGTSHYSGVDHISLSRLFNRFGLFQSAFVYQNTTPEVEEWEICALGVRSERKNHFNLSIEESLAELYQSIPRRTAERDAELARGRTPAVEKRAVITAQAPPLHEHPAASDALSVCQDWIDRAPADPLAWTAKARLFLSQGRPAVAAEVCREAMARGVQAVPVIKTLGDCLLALGRFADAAGAFDRVLGADPEHAEATANLGQARLRLGDAETARALCRKAVALKPTLGSLHLALGTVLRSMGRHEDAFAAFHHALMAQPTLVDAYRLAGEALEAAGRAGEARPYVDAAARFEAVGRIPDAQSRQAALNQAAAACAMAVADGRPSGPALVAYGHALEIEARQLLAEARSCYRMAGAAAGAAEGLGRT